MKKLKALISLVGLLILLILYLALNINWDEVERRNTIVPLFSQPVAESKVEQIVDNDSQRAATIITTVIAPLLLLDDPKFEFDYCGQIEDPDADNPSPPMTCSGEGFYAATLNTLAHLRRSTDDLDGYCDAMYVYERCKFDKFTELNDCTAMQRSLGLYGNQFGEYSNHCR